MIRYARLCDVDVIVLSDNNLIAVYIVTTGTISNKMHNASNKKKIKMTTSLYTVMSDTRDKIGFDTILAGTERRGLSYTLARCIHVI